MSAFQTPRKKLTAWLLALSWLALQPTASWVYYETNFRRGAYPPEADTIIIGQMPAVMGWVVTLPIFLVFFWFCFRQYPGRVSFLAFTRERPAWSSIWSTILIALGAIEVWSLVGSILGLFPLDVLSELLAIYLLLCCRSSLMYSKVGVVHHESIQPHAMESSCQCSAVGRGVQTFRIRQPRSLFDIVADVGSDHARFMDARAVWSCRGCGQRFAWMRITYKDHEEILVRAESADWQSWDWSALADIADGCRWRGPELDQRYVV